MKNKLTALEKSWILYDIGNSAYILLVATLVPIWFEHLTSTAGLADHEYLSLWSFAGSISTIIVAVLGPILGTLADSSGYKKPLWLIFMLLGAVGCGFLGGPWGYMAFLVLFIVTKVGFSGSLVFYDSMLPEITSPERMDRLSAQGYAYGYIGSVIPFLVCLVLVLAGGSFGLDTASAMTVSFLITAVWWTGCSVPLARRYRQTASVSAQGSAIGASFKRLYATFKEAKRHKHIFVYLVAFFFFIDGVYTIIDLATAYGKSMGLDTTGLLLALLLTQIVAFPFSILFGRLSARYDTGLLIKVSIGCYTFITLFAVFLKYQWQFWILAVLVGMFQGGIQAMSRSYLGKIIPPEQSGEYYGLMDICGKGASFVGTTMVGTVSALLGQVELDFFGYRLHGTNLAVGTLVVLFVVGFVLFCQADKLNRQRRA